MKLSWFFLLVIALGFCFLGCGGSDESEGADGDSDADNDTDTDADSDTDSDSDTDTDMDIDSDADTDGDTDTDSDTDIDTDSDTDADSDGDTDTEHIDQDGDGWIEGIDCDDTNPDANQDEDEIYDPPNGVDEDCDGLTDEEDEEETTFNMLPDLWYSVDNLLVRIELSEVDGSVVGVTSRTISDQHVGQNCLTMLLDGSLIGARLSKDDYLTRFYYIENPYSFSGAQEVNYTDLGIMPDDIMLEGLYTDCDGRLYGMDTGTDDTNSDGNRLLRFTGDYVAGDFSYEVISDLSEAYVADIDDMGPGIGEDGEITDNPGMAIDSGHIYDFDFVEGTGNEVAMGGNWGIHALGGDLFNDGVSRVYLLSSTAELFELDPDTYEVSDVLVTGPTPENGNAGWSGLAGPLTDCETGFPTVL